MKCVQGGRSSGTVSHRCLYGACRLHVRPAARLYGDPLECRVVVPCRRVWCGAQPPANLLCCFSVAVVLHVVTPSEGLEQTDMSFPHFGGSPHTWYGSTA